jgi:hypothetical protein
MMSDVDLTRSALRATAMLRHLTPHMREFAKQHNMLAVDTLWICLYLLKAACTESDSRFADAHAALLELYNIDAAICEWSAERDKEPT